MTGPSLGSRAAKVWLATAGAFVPYCLIVWFLGSATGARGADLWVLRLGLWLAGLVLAVGGGLWVLGRPPKEREVSGDELDTTIAAARARLVASRVARRASFRDLPMVLFLGPDGATKTTSIVHSGLEPDLLAGDVHQGDQIAPTRVVNLWYTQKTVLLEVAAKLAGDAARWKRLLRSVRPSRLAALLPGRAQAPRAAVVCYSVEELLKPGSAAAVPAAARDLRQPLVDLAREFGVRLPVYVLFTKADRIPFFAEFVRNLSRDEAQEVLGVTLRWPPVTTPGVYGDREFQRITDAFDRLGVSLGEKRVPLLAREAEAERRGATYEFPREFRKLVQLATQFLVDLCRPSQLHVNPVLRGFYFTGVRPVVVSDVGPAVAPRGPGAGRVGATQLFDPASQRAPVLADPVGGGGAGGGGAGRKVPQWVFLGRLFREVVLGDRVASAAAFGSLRVHLTRRVALSTVAAVFLLWLLGLPLSCFNNRSLASRAVGALRGVQVGSPEGELAGPEALRNLETLRQQVERLADYQRHGVPVLLRLGLYQGSDLYKQLGREYLDGLERLLLRPARESMRRSLRGLVDAGAQYEPVYDLLRAYLMTTTRPDRIDTTFLPPVLLAQWLGNWQVDDARRDLAERQFRFYAAKLCATFPCEAAADDPTVDQTRVFLKRFTGPEGMYRQMVSSANAGNPPVRFRSTSGLADPYEVAGAFTRAGWDFVDRYLRDKNRFQTEDWVLEERFEPSQLRDELRNRYRADYVRQWRGFLDSAAVPAFTDRKGAAAILKDLSGPQSPLVQLLSLVARNTGVDSPTVGKRFQAVHIVTPPDAKDNQASDLLKPYMQALIELQTLVEQAATAGPAEAQQLQEKTSEGARNAKAQVGQIATNFRGEGDAVAVGTAVSGLLEEPISRTEALMRGLPGMALNARGGDFCRVFGPLTQRFPFNRTGSDADLRDVIAMFQPAEGELWRFYNEALRDVLVRSGSQYMGKPGARVSPEFVNFFSRAAGFSDALWKTQGTEPQFEFAVRIQPSAAVPSVALVVDGVPARWTQADLRLRPFSWVGARAGQVTLSAQLRGREEEIRKLPGTWAIFRLFREASGWRRAADEYAVQFNFQDRGVTLDAQLNLSGRAPILSPDYFAGFRCVSRVVQ